MKRFLQALNTWFIKKPRPGKSSEGPEGMRGSLSILKYPREITRCLHAILPSMDVCNCVQENDAATLLQEDPCTLLVIKALLQQTISGRNWMPKTEVYVKKLWWIYEWNITWLQEKMRFAFHKKINGTAGITLSKMRRKSYCWSLSYVEDNETKQRKRWTKPNPQI